ncbi:protein LSM12 homolog [Varroa jacobsoni]|uniref:AD domain-containing protein n=1 Tax=Varroa destructor TaxID=109461 RepID=A0A7M7KW08_VARDE|nr:protein LSM12 homolog [Varroa destructor]XP_022707780.1 protein LSM12 homolog [Varroa jacobsoni]
MSGASCGSCGDNNNRATTATGAAAATAIPAAAAAAVSSVDVGGSTSSSSSSSNNSSSNSAMGLPEVVPEVFQLGCVVSIESPFNERFNGEVIAFDDKHKALLLKSSSGGDNQRKTTDVRLVNMLYVSKMNIEREAPAHNSAPLPPAQVNIEKVKSRMMKHVDERRKMALAIAKGVSYDGLSLFLAIRKTIEEVTWHEKDILVMNSVRIQPPYRPENCVPSNEAHSAEHQSVAHIRNIVEKHLKDIRKEQDSRGNKDGPTGGL